MNPPTQQQAIPIIRCKRMNPYQIGFYCEYCKRIHYHGLGEGHRGCHCQNPDSPYHLTGYNLVEEKL